jgi:hypothetical protein
MSDDEDQWGRYTIVRAIAYHFEHTNIGVMIYGPDGKLTEHRMDTVDRAVRRGDLPASVLDDPYFLDHVARYGESYPDVEAVEWAHYSTGHAMSSIQIGDLCGTKMRPGQLDEIFDRFIPKEARP